AGTIFLAAEHDQWNISFLVVHSGVVDICLWSALLSEVTGETTFNTVQHLVADTDVCKCPANHDFVVTAAGSVGVEVLTCHTVFNKVPACWSVRFESPCR